MNNVRHLLIKELDKYGIKILNNSECSCIKDGNENKSTIVTKIQFLKKDHIRNTKIIKQLLLESVKLLCDNRTLARNNVLSQKLVNISIDSIYGIYHFSKVLTFSEDYKDFITKHNICEVLRKSFDKDYLDFSSVVLNCMSNYRIALDWVYRKNTKIEYVASILGLFLQGDDVVDNIVIKEARGVQGPWGNLDLPMQERVFNWDEVSGETYGRDKDKRKQQRYLMGYDTYNKAGKVGEGYYWREHRNEPFSWSNRFTDSPYPQLKPGTWR